MGLITFTIRNRKVLRAGYIIKKVRLRLLALIRRNQRQNIDPQTLRDVAEQIAAQYAYNYLPVMRLYNRFRTRDGRVYVLDDPPVNSVRAAVFFHYLLARWSVQRTQIALHALVQNYVSFKRMIKALEDAKLGPVMVKVEVRFGVLTVHRKIFSRPFGENAVKKPRRTFWKAIRVTNNDIMIRCSIYFYRGRSRKQEAKGIQILRDFKGGYGIFRGALI